MDSLAHLMLAPDSARHEDIATDLGLEMVAAGGLRALTATALAGRCGCSRQAVQQWFGQEELRHVVARVFGVRWRRWACVRVHISGLGGLLPDSDEVVAWCRVWLALIEHAPRDPRVAEVVDVIRYAERREIGAVLGRDQESGEVALIHALVEGLRARLCAPDPELSIERAGRLLEVSRWTFPSDLACAQARCGMGGRRVRPDVTPVT